MDEPTTTRSVSWDTPGNAERYAAYAATHPLYRETSRALIDAVHLRPGDAVVDLCCGTGATTEELLRSSADVSVFALDYAASQIAIARDRIDATGVTFVHGPAERVHELVAVPCDAVICNAAVWQLAPAAVRAVAAVLRPGGSFAFNLPAAFASETVARLTADDPEMARAARRQEGSIERAMLDEARERHGYDPARTARAGGAGFVEGRFLSALGDAGLRALRSSLLSVRITPEAAFDWYSIPVFRSNVLPRMSADDSERVLIAAYEKWRPTAHDTLAVWANFVASKDG